MHPILVKLVIPIDSAQPQQKQQQLKKLSRSKIKEPSVKWHRRTREIFDACEEAFVFEIKQNRTGKVYVQ